MISENHFSAGYTSVWHAVSPLSDGYWKLENMFTKRIVAPMQSRAKVSHRAVVNELGFMVFCDLASSAPLVTRAQVLLAAESRVGDAVKYINRLASSKTLSIKTMDVLCMREAAQISLRLLHFFSGFEKFRIRPKFSGCGLLSECEGDIVYGDCLYEVKAGDRAFRISDVRQLLVYAALAYANRELTFTRIGLFNPRTGLEWSKTLDEVCIAIAGLRANDTLSSLVNQFSLVSVSR